MPLADHSILEVTYIVRLSSISQCPNTHTFPVAALLTTFQDPQVTSSTLESPLRLCRSGNAVSQCGALCEGRDLTEIQVHTAVLPFPI